MKNKIKNDEIDLIEVIINIWNNKFKISAITVIIMVISVACYYIIKPPLKAKTEILPITIFENSLYEPYNAMIAPLVNIDKELISKKRLNNLDRKYFLSLFIEELRTSNILIEAIKKYQLINKEKFINEDDYLEVVEKFALKVNLLGPINVDGSGRGESRLNWIIEHAINDKDKWEEALSFVENRINDKIQKYLEINFNLTFNNLKMLNQYKLEDLNQKIKFAKNDYELETSNRLAFLNEQASIARELNIKNNTLEVENFSTPSGVISNLQTAKPYYMRGYSMIEKEIELIETRNNKDAFTQNLYSYRNQFPYKNSKKI